MKKQLQVMAVSLASILSVASAHAGMIEAQNGDTIYVTYGANNPKPLDNDYGGGEFLISDNMLSRDYQYIGFCLEKNELLMPYPDGSGNYKLDPDTGVADFAENGPDSGYAEREDYLSNASKWLMNQYVTNYSSFYNTYKGSATDTDQFAGLVQDAIWFFEDEIPTENSLTDYILNTVFAGKDGKSYQANFLTSVKVLNIVTGSGAFRQSVVVAATPEPATMLLLGTGLAGLVGVMRSRRKKENEI